MSTPFWVARWLLGTAPEEMALELYNTARFKNRSVSAELRNDSWIRNLG
jgi:hypothetical protein